MKKLFLLFYLSLLLSSVLLPGNLIDKKNNRLIEFKTVQDLSNILQRYAKRDLGDLTSRNIISFIVEGMRSKMKKIGSNPAKFDFVIDKLTKFYAMTVDGLNSSEMMLRKEMSKLPLFVVRYSVKYNSVIHIVDTGNHIVYARNN